MTDSKLDYRELLANEQAAWQRLWDSRDGNSHDPVLMAEWLVASRACTVARDSAIDTMLGKPPAPPPMKQIPLDALPDRVQEAVRRNLHGTERGSESDFGVCILDPAAGGFACVSAQNLQQLSKLAVDLVDSGFALADKSPEGCACDYVFDPIK